MAKKVQTEKFEVKSEFDPTHERDFTTVAVLKDDNGNININASTENDGESHVVTFSLYLRSFDKESKKWQTSSELEKRAEEVVQNNFTDVESVDDLVERGLTDDMEFTGYTDGKSGFWYPRPPRPDKISTGDSKDLAKATGPFTVGPVIDNDRFGQFQFTFFFDNAEGETKMFKVSQITVPAEDRNEDDENLSTKYVTRKVEDIINAMNQSAENLSEEKIEKMKRSVDQLKKRERANKVAEINAQLGVDVDELIEDGEGVVFDSLEVQKIDQHFWLRATPAFED